MGFGDSALNFELLCWTDDFDNRLRVISELNHEIAERFRERDIEIPYPQQDLHLRSAEAGLLEALSDKGRNQQRSDPDEKQTENPSPSEKPEK